MGILDEKRYADNMTRREVADALKNGHPLIAGYLVADAAKQMQENDALLKVLEQQSGISQPGQSITDKLEAYLRNPNAAEQQRPEGPPGGPPKGPPRGPPEGQPGGPPRRPGSMPQGGPTPGPRVPGGAGGPMPGMLRGPQGAGAPMRRGGIVGFQNGGLPGELEWTGILGDVPRGEWSKGTRQLDDPIKDFLRFIGRRGADVYGQGLRGKRILANIASAFGRKYNGDEHGPYRNPEGELLMEGLGSTERWDPERRGYSGMKRLIESEEEVPGYQNAGLVEPGADFGARGLETDYGPTPDWTTDEGWRMMNEDVLSGSGALSAIGGVGTGAWRLGKAALSKPASALGGIRSLYGRGRGALDVGAGRVAEQIARRGGRPGRWLASKLTGAGYRTPQGAVGGGRFFDPVTGRFRSGLAAGHSAINRLAGTGAGVVGAVSLMDLITRGDGDDLGLGDGDGDGGRRFPDDPGAGRSPSQDIFEKIGAYRTAAGIPTEAEKNQNKLDEDRAKELGDYRTGIAGLRPTDEQYRLRGRGVGFGALSKALARTGDPTERQDFGQIGESIRGETDRQLAERLGFEDKLAGIDTSIYGVESGSLGRQALRSRAGEAYNIPELEMIIQQARDEAEYKRSMDVARVGLEGRNQVQIGRLLELLADPTIVGETRNQILEYLASVGGGGSSEGVNEFSGRMEQAQGAR